MPLVAVVTGANSGVGLALCDRLLTEYPDIKLCMVCRNQGRAQAAKDSLLQQHNDADISVVLADIGNITSTRQGAKELLKKFTHIDFLYLNAGVMASSRINYSMVCRTLLEPSKWKHRFTTGADLLLISDGTTSEGLKTTFATNVFGHFVLIQELLDILGGSEVSRIIFTSSRTAKKEKFSIDDIQHNSGIDPYASSKYMTDSLALALNNKYNSKNIYAHTTCPGFVMTGLTQSLAPSYFWYTIGIPTQKMLRLVVASNSIIPYNGAEALVWLAKQDPASLDAKDKYFSCCSVFGYPYTETSQMPNTLEEGMEVFEKLTELSKQMK